MAALKKPMVAVHRGRQTADHAVLSTIKDLVKEAQQFMQRYIPGIHRILWRNGVLCEGFGGFRRHAERINSQGIDRRCGDMDENEFRYCRQVSRRCKNETREFAQEPRGNAHVELLGQASRR